MRPTSPRSTRRLPRRAGLALALLVAGGSFAGVALAAQGDTELLSRQSESAGSAAGDDDSRNPSTSANGRYVAFTSGATNLSDGDVDVDESDDIFVRDTVTDVTTLVSRRSEAGGGQGADSYSREPSISANGRYVAFHSMATNLSPADGDQYFDVFVRDTQANTTALVSRRSESSGGQAGAGDSVSAEISDDGRYVAFESSAGNLSGGDQDGVSDIFVRDLQTDTTTLVSRSGQASGGQGGDGDSYISAISANGRHVAFASDAANLTGVEDEDVADIFVRDTQANTTTLVSRRSQASGGQGSDNFSRFPSISNDGRYVAFSSGATNFPQGSLPTEQVYLRDLQSETTTPVSRSSQSSGGTMGNDRSTATSISADGRYVAFSSDATNLSADDGATTRDVFVRDTQVDTTSLISRSSQASGNQAANGSTDFGASISGDGRYVAFDSDATNLSGADGDPFVDVFRRDVLGP